MTSTPTKESFIYRPRSYVETLPLAELFPTAAPLEVELGAGDGTFLARYAAARPERSFLGVERLLGRLRKLDRKILRGGLTNVRLLRIEASYFLEFLLPPLCVAALHVYFPDPWPKRKHRERRLVNERFIKALRRVLVPGGKIYFRTDDADYFAQIQRVFGEAADFRGAATPSELGAIRTDFEEQFEKRGVPIFRQAYSLIYQ